MSDLSFPPAAVFVRHPVADFDAWKSAFDEHEGMRRDAGVLGYHISRDEDDPNMVSVYLAVSDLDKAKKFARRRSSRRSCRTPASPARPR